MSKITRISRQYVSLWSFLFLVFILGIIRPYLLHKYINDEQKSLLYLAIGSILVTGFLWMIISLLRGRHIRTEEQIDETPVFISLQSRMFPLVIFPLTQMALFSLAIIVWINLQVPSPSSLNRIPYWFWAFTISLAVLICFLNSQIKNIHQFLSPPKSLIFKDIALLLFSSFTSVVIGLIAASFSQDYMGHLLHLSSMVNTFVLDLFFPFFVFDLNLLLLTLFAATQNAMTAALTRLANKRIGNIKAYFLHNQAYNLLFSPWAGSLLTAITFFLLSLSFFRPRYGTNDDIDMVSIAAGYLGGKSFPFLVYSNVLLGLALNSLYSLHTNVNWEIWLFLFINFLSVWALIYIILSSSKNAQHRLIGTLIVLICDSYFILNITFTNIAAFASLAGICLILAGVQSLPAMKNGLLLSVYGIGLVLIASLIRVETILLIFMITLPVVILLHKSFNQRNLIATFVIAGILIIGCYVFDRSYLRSSPDWYSYDTYNNVRSSIFDTPRIQNLETQMRSVGWSANDTALFASWFYPNKSIYSLEHLQYLVDHIPNTSQSKTKTTELFFDSLFGSSLLASYVLIMLSIWLWMLLRDKFFGAIIFSLLVVMFVTFAMNIYLAWAFHDPEHVLVPSLAAGIIISFLILDWHNPSRSTLTSRSINDTGFSRLGYISLLLSLILVTGLTLAQSIIATRTNINTQEGYQKVLLDLRNLQSDGQIPKNALIVSTVSGIPLEWANPMWLEFPDIQILQMGTLTFSPPYEQVLHKFGIQSLIEALYQKDYVFILARNPETILIARYIKQHNNITVAIHQVYEIDYDFELQKFHNIRLYKAEEEK